MSDPAKLPVSVCILCLNEADRLRRCLAPLAGFAEILVLDSGSTDGSQAICREYGATVHEGPWLGFAAQRRRLFGLAKQPWILWLDADEVVRPELLAELRALFASGEPPLPAYRLNRLVIFEGREIRHGNWFPDRCIRLFRTDAWAMPDRAVHESLEIRGDIGNLRGLLEHHTYRDWDDLRRRADRYARLWAAQAAAEGRTAAPLTGPLRAFWRFFRGFVLRRGFLDGALGYRIAKANGAEVALKYRLLRERVVTPEHRVPAFSGIHRISLPEGVAWMATRGRIDVTPESLTPFVPGLTSNVYHWDDTTLLKVSLTQTFPRNALLRAVGLSRASFECRSAIVLARMGIRAPRITALASAINPFGKIDSIHLMERVPAGQCGIPFLNDAAVPHDIRVEFVRQVIRDLRRIIDGGMVLRDFRLNNIMASGHDPRPYWIDNELKHPLTRRHLRKRLNRTVKRVVAKDLPRIPAVYAEMLKAELQQLNESA